MTLTYAAADTLSQARDAVRLLIHDTDSDRELLDDSEVDFCLDSFGLDPTGDDPTDNKVAVRKAAAMAARAVAAKFASQSQTGIAEVSGAAQSTSDRYMALAALLDEDAIPWLLR